MASITLMLVFLLILLLPLFLFFHKYTSLDRRKKQPPSPRKLPIIGNLYQLGSLAHHSLRSLSRKHGDMMLLHLGSTPTLVVSSPEAASLVLKTHDLAFCSRPNWSLLSRLLNNGKDVIGAPYGDYWRHMRSICVLQLLSNKRVQSFRRVREEEVALMVHKIKQLPSSSSSVVNMRNVFHSLSGDIVSRVALGTKSSGGHGDEFRELLGEISELLGKFSIGYFIPWLAWIDRFNGVYARVNEVTKGIDQLLESIIDEHSSSSGGGDGGTAKDFVQVLLDLENGNDTTTGHMPIDRESIKGLILDMFAGGTDSISSVLEWMMSEILMNPKVKKKLQQEVKQVVGDGKETVTEDELKHMVYLRATIQETLRLHPPAPLLSPRACIQDVKVEDYDISAGTLVFVNCWAIGRDTRYWEDPESFSPERFLDDSSMTDSKDHSFRMIQFGYGRRGCPGEAFALVIIELAMANLLAQFDWKLPFGGDQESRKEHPGITTKRATPLLAVATPTILH